MEKFLGVDLGGTNVKFGLVSSDGQLESKVKHPTKELALHGKFVSNFIDALKVQLNENPEINKIGIGVPGTISKDRRQTLEMANVPQLNGVYLMDELERFFPGKSFHIENDANAAALGEYYFGTETLPDTYIFITLGTGVGSAAIIDKDIFKGGDGNGMEVGHIVAGNGKTVEQNIGKKGILSLAIHELAAYKGETILHKYDELDAKKVVKAAKKGDYIALKIFEDVGEILGQALVSTIRILDIKTIIIGGGVSQIYETIRNSMDKSMQSYLTPYYTNKLDVRLATLGNEAGIIGAASLCFID